MCSRGRGFRTLRLQRPEVGVSPELPDKMRVLTQKLEALNNSNSKEADLIMITNIVKDLCDTGDDLRKCADIIFKFGLRNKWNAHVMALLCNHLSDVAVGEVKFRFVLLKTLQSSYSERVIKYSEIDKFIMDVVFLCQIFHYLRLADGSCYRTLARPIFDYFHMLVCGGTGKEIEIVREMIEQCFIDLKQSDDEGLEIFLKKIRKIISHVTTGVSTRAMLLEMFELILTNWKPLDPSTKELYDALTKPIEKLPGKMCELTQKLEALNTSNSKEADLIVIANIVKGLSDTHDDLRRCVDIIFSFGLRNKWNAHVIALLCSHLSDIAVGEVKFPSMLLKELQSSYSERSLMCSKLDKFSLDVIFHCEIFHHLRLADGSCYRALARPVFDYFKILIDGGTEAEIEVVREQIGQCFIDLKKCDNEGLEMLLKKIRKQIISTLTGTSVKAMLLEMFELMLTDWKPFDPSTKAFYGVLTKPVEKVCQ